MAIKKPHKYRFILLQKLDALGELVIRDRKSPAFTPNQQKACERAHSIIAGFHRRLNGRYTLDDLRKARHWLDHEWPKVWERIQSAYIPPEHARRIRKARRDAEELKTMLGEFQSFDFTGDFFTSTGD